MLEHRRGLEPKTISAERSTPQARNPEASACPGEVATGSPTRTCANIKSTLCGNRRGARSAAANSGALTMSMIEKRAPRSEAEEWKYAEKALTWYGWGSPVGLSIFLVSIGIVLVLIHQAGLLR
jgi:hypothetical protein